MKENVNIYNGVGLCSLLTIIFVIAKLAGVINWSWWLVFLPSIISVGLSILIFILIIIAYIWTR